MGRSVLRGHGAGETRGSHICESVHILYTTGPSPAPRTRERSNKTLTCTATIGAASVSSECRSRHPRVILALWVECGRSQLLPAGNGIARPRPRGEPR